MAAENDPLPPDVFFETIRSGSVNYAEDPAKFVNAVSSEDWRSKIINGLSLGAFCTGGQERGKTTCPSGAKLFNSQ